MIVDNRGEEEAGRSQVRPRIRGQRVTSLCLWREKEEGWSKPKALTTGVCFSSKKCLLPQKSFQSAFIVKPLALEGVLMGLRGGSLEGVGCPWSVSLVQDFFNDKWSLFSIFSPIGVGLSRDSLGCKWSASLHTFLLNFNKKGQILIRMFTY